MEKHEENRIIAELMPILSSVRYRLKSDLYSFPMALLNEDHAHHIHGQSLKRLAQRGGMGYDEIICNMKKLSYDDLKNLDESECLDACKEIVQYYNQQKEK